MPQTTSSNETSVKGFGVRGGQKKAAKIIGITRNKRSRQPGFRLRDPSVKCPGGMNGEQQKQKGEGKGRCKKAVRNCHLQGTLERGGRGGECMAERTRSGGEKNRGKQSTKTTCCNKKPGVMELRYLAIFRASQRREREHLRKLGSAHWGDKSRDGRPQLVRDKRTIPLGLGRVGGGRVLGYGKGILW